MPEENFFFFSHDWSAMNEPGTPLDTKEEGSSLMNIWCSFWLLATVCVQVGSRKSLNNMAAEKKNKKKQGSKKKNVDFMTRLLRQHKLSKFLFLFFTGPTLAKVDWLYYSSSANEEKARGRAPWDPGRPSRWNKLFGHCHRRKCPSQWLGGHNCSHLGLRGAIQRFRPSPRWSWKLPGSPDVIKFFLV